MTNRTITTSHASGTGRRVALAASVALVAVTGTATVAWRALSLALGPELSAQAPALAQAPEAPVRVALSTQSRDAQRLDNAAQPRLFGGAAPAPQSAERTVRPIPRPVPRPVAAAPEPMLVSAPAAPVIATPRPRTAASESRLHRLWSTGLFR